jgi:hypothetical protein
MLLITATWTPDPSLSSMGCLMKELGYCPVDLLAWFDCAPAAVHSCLFFCLPRPFLLYDAVDLPVYGLNQPPYPTSTQALRNGMVSSIVNQIILLWHPHTYIKAPPAVHLTCLRLRRLPLMASTYTLVRRPDTGTDLHRGA